MPETATGDGGERRRRGIPGATVGFARRSATMIPRGRRVRLGPKNAPTTARRNLQHRKLWVARVLLVVPGHFLTKQYVGHTDSIHSDVATGQWRLARALRGRHTT